MLPGMLPVLLQPELGEGWRLIGPANAHMPDLTGSGCDLPNATFGGKLLSFRSRLLSRRRQDINNPACEPECFEMPARTGQRVGDRCEMCRCKLCSFCNPSENEYRSPTGARLRTLTSRTEVSCRLECSLVAVAWRYHATFPLLAASLHVCVQPT